ncbi:MAG: hypothetical protein RBG13Loki_4192 [Promethearchaeota archaeon CR_4]|nr:MAG: hypothetical protein RBG13Loki_4192 [Candidatus Lokiarchaeota archaeon CR_4]
MIARNAPSNAALRTDSVPAPTIGENVSSLDPIPNARKMDARIVMIKRASMGKSLSRKTII